MSSRRTTFNHIKMRHLAACLISLVTATVMIPGMSTYLPLSTPDKIGLPIFLFTFLWAGFFIYSYLAKNVWHPMLVMSLLLVSHLTLSILALQ